MTYGRVCFLIAPGLVLGRVVFFDRARFLGRVAARVFFDRARFGARVFFDRAGFGMSSMVT